ncbi:uncharacterized protein ALTATR162_LOCUS7806 [Alternaria atra]|uniref:Uncharacterized protein n=1 Tax=Alternaria atra TaxID=119953 RepID=A0A8J2N1S2_9PLEO|nr:uncharacterized protein ALTATR162_LOCUS7806 [Alternaria atra]CAG5174520.1 unnamed protein product [Alternaria atra]
MIPSHLNNSVDNTRNAISPNDAFRRLRWSIFEDVSNIRVLDDPQMLDSPFSRTQNPSFSPFVGHAIATEPASQIPLTEIAFSISDLVNYACELPSELNIYTEPEDLRVRRADGGIVTVADVVEQLSAYFITYKEDILLAKDCSEQRTRYAHERKVYNDNVPSPGEDKEIPADPDVFFDGFFGIIEPTMSSLPVELWTAEDGSSYNPVLPS